MNRKYQSFYKYETVLLLHLKYQTQIGKQFLIWKCWSRVKTTTKITEIQNLLRNMKLFPVISHVCSSMKERTQEVRASSSRLHLFGKINYILSKPANMFRQNQSLYFVKNHSFLSKLHVYNQQLYNFVENQHLCSGKNTYMCIYILIFQNR